MNVAVIGLGYWGPNLVRNCLENKSIAAVYAFDVNPARLQDIQDKFSAVIIDRDYAAILKNDAIEAVLIATPISTHYQLALDAINSGKHVVVEKPLAASIREAAELVEVAERKSVILMVDHTFIYTPAVRKIKQLIDADELGAPYYFDSVRINLGSFQTDANVLWDLASHDFSIMNYLLDERPKTVSATGAAHIKGSMENIAYVHVGFDDGLIAHFHLNWLSPVKIRKIIIAGEKKMITYDDLDQLEKVKVYDSGVTLTDREQIHQSLVQYRTGDMYAPQIDNREALSIMVEHLVDCIQQGRQPITGAKSGLDIVRLLEAATESIRHSGKIIQI